MEVKNFVRDWHELKKKLAKDRIVFTNGCFDILHVGHIRYLEQAKAFGGYLVVGINSDSSVRSLKGPNRPIHNEETRSEVLCALRCVDFVTVFSQSTPYQLLEVLLPDILVKGGDWDEEKIVGANLVKQNGGKVFSLKYHEGHSTTGILKSLSKL